MNTWDTTKAHKTYKREDTQQNFKKRLCQPKKVYNNTQFFIIGLNIHKKKVGFYHCLRTN